MKIIANGSKFICCVCNQTQLSTSGLQLEDIDYWVREKYEEYLDNDGNFSICEECLFFTLISVSFSKESFEKFNQEHIKFCQDFDKNQEKIERTFQKIDAKSKKLKEKLMGSEK